MSTRAVLLSEQLHLNFYFVRGCQHCAREDGGCGGAGLVLQGMPASLPAPLPAPLPVAAGATPLLRSRETWAMNVGVCQCWQHFSAGEDKFLLEVSLGSACLKNYCLFKICRIGENSALIP